MIFDCETTIWPCHSNFKFTVMKEGHIRTKKVIDLFVSHFIHVTRVG